MTLEAESVLLLLDIPDNSERCAVASRDLGSAGAAQQLGQLADAGPLLAAIDRVFDLGDARWGQHGAGQFAKFVADFAFGEGQLEIAAMALRGVRRPAAVAQRQHDVRWAQ